MHKKLQQILKELTEISGICFALYESPEEYVEGTLTENALSEKQLEELFSGAEREPAVEGYVAFPVRAAEERLLLIAEGNAPAVLVPGRMAASELQLFFDAIKKDTDKNAFAAVLLTGDIPASELYKQAGRLKLKDVPRVLYLFELAQPLEDTSALRMLTSLFADGRQDLLFLEDEKHLVLIKAYEKGVNAERAEKDVLSAMDTMLSELMIKTRVGYSTPKETLAELTDAKREAALALRIAGIFQEQREVVAYSKLGIARLIYELPKDLCEMFLQEVFGEKLPDQDIDEEMQVTIRLFFENNLNISETARQLYLHRNTLVYRLERFEKLVGLDIRRFDDAMTFQIAMMVLAHYRQM
ncbi:MAG: helix-turn-helix domain-containing protein [Eubacterium sp.]|nr:helix-turn-helix domain-containing protein [Eubacterium sp.]